jgi:hypothetical protein
MIISCFRASRKSAFKKLTFSTDSLSDTTIASLSVKLWMQTALPISGRPSTLTGTSAFFILARSCASNSPRSPTLIFVHLSTPGIIKNRPGPLSPKNLPKRYTMNLWFSRAIFMLELAKINRNIQRNIKLVCIFPHLASSPKVKKLTNEDSPSRDLLVLRT